MRFSNLSEWLSWLENLPPKAINLGLERVKTVLQQAGLTKPAPYVITVAGTNGKGSCVALLEAILLAGGHKVGCYTSPHLLRYNERIKINGQPVSDLTLCEAFASIDAICKDISLTYFEFGTLAAFYLFKQQALDVVVLEVGLGGRLDAVNSIDNDLAMISGVDFDHMNYLGNTREAIGFEKAGIMRHEKPIVYGGIDIPASIIHQAQQVGSPLYFLGRDYYYQVTDASWQWQSSRNCYTHLPLPQLAVQNVATVLQTHELLPSKFQVNLAMLKLCIAKTQLAGRFQHITLPKQATLILDVAHNPQSCILLAERLRAEPCQGITYGLVAMLKDKDIAGSLQPLLKVIDCWYVAGLTVARGATATLMGGYLNQLGVANYTAQPDITDAYQQIITKLKPHDRIIVFGSFYTVGAILALQESGK